VVGAAILGIMFFQEPVTVIRITCIALIIIGIVGLKVFSGTTVA
jgi:quaternary ammonium compound-resistance protein SugE